MPDIEVRKHAELFANRIAKNQRRLGKALERRNIGAYRLYDRDIPEVRAVADWYEGHLVVAEYVREQTDGLKSYAVALAHAAADKLGVPRSNLHVKARTTGRNETGRYEKLADVGRRLEVREGDLRFWVNLDDYIDTGLFSDHRKTRALIGSETRGRRFLNLFAYTGTFSVYALHNGAAHVTTVDLSSTYLDWANANVELNAANQRAHDIVRADALEYIDQARSRRERWDVVFIDPPSFSTRGGPDGEFDVLQDHRDLIERAASLVSPGGVLYFSTNHQRFEPDLGGLSAEEITERTVPEDYRNRQIHRIWRIQNGSRMRRQRTA